MTHQQLIEQSPGWTETDCLSFTRKSPQVGSADMSTGVALQNHTSGSGYITCRTGSRSPHRKTGVSSFSSLSWSGVYLGLSRCAIALLSPVIYLERWFHKHRTRQRRWSRSKKRFLESRLEVHIPVIPPSILHNTPILLHSTPSLLHTKPKSPLPT